MEKNKNFVKAVNRNVRSSPRKVNNLLKDIRGKKVDMVIRNLSFAKQRIAFDIKKTVQSAAKTIAKISSVGSNSIIITGSLYFIGRILENNS